MPYPVLAPVQSLPPAPSAVRRTLAALLESASRALGRLAQVLAERPARHARAQVSPLVEFHAEAGAPEGALYVDGQLVAMLPGVTRL
jgi:hypothetical protein